MTPIRSAIVAGFAAVALLVAPALAQAAQGFIVSDTTLKAGPDEQFPDVDSVTAGTEVIVNGCLGGFSWCDISFQQDRGWVSGQDLEVMFQNNRVKVVEATTEVVPAVTFEVAIYWDQHYRERPFYKDRDRFASINININNGGKAAPGATGSGGQASVTDKTKLGKAATEGAAAAGGAQANATGKEATGGTPAQGGVKSQAATDNKGCPAGQKDCKAQAGANGKTATGGGMAADKASKGAMPTANAKDCKPGTPNCPKGATKNGG
jgi:uncharacterized protein YraI